MSPTARHVLRIATALEDHGGRIWFVQQMTSQAPQKAEPYNLAWSALSTAHTSILPTPMEIATSSGRYVGHLAHGICAPLTHHSPHEIRSATLPHRHHASAYCCRECMHISLFTSDRRTGGIMDKQSSFRRPIRLLLRRQFGLHQ